MFGRANFGWFAASQPSTISARDRSTVDLFRDVAALLPAFEPCTLDRGRQLFAQRDVDQTDVFVVLHGRFTVAREHRDRRAVTAVLGPGDMVGELSVFDPGPRTSTVTVVTGGRAAVLARADLLAWGTSRPHVAARLLQVLARRLRRTNSTIVDLMFVDVAGRTAKALLELAARFGQRHGPEVWVPHGLTQAELGQLVGGSRETVEPPCQAAATSRPPAVPSRFTAVDPAGSSRAAHSAYATERATPTSRRSPTTDNG